MKKLGLVGGMGPESTIPYYRGIVHGVQKRVGRPFFPRLAIESVDVFEVLRLCGEKNYGKLTDYLLDAITSLARGGADFAALSANTPHIVFDQLRERSPVPLVSIVETARDEAVRQGLRRIGLLGTVFTMTGAFFREPFAASGIELVVPEEEELRFVNEKITSELELGIAREETQAGFQAILARMKQDHGIEAVLLGCTELPLILNDRVSPVPCLDTMELHIQALVEQILSETGPSLPA